MNSHSNGCQKSCLLLARVGRCGCETSASGEGLLCWRGAGQAARLAPVEKAVGFAVLGTVLTCGRIALRARGGNANGRSEAAVELVMVELSSDDVESCGAASVGLVANDLRISKLALFITRASTCDLSLQLIFARVSRCCCETRASGEGLLCWRGAGQAARLAPAEKAVGLAVLGT